MKNIIEQFKNEHHRNLILEGITDDVLEMVDLDIEFSPVIPIRNEKPCEVKKTIGGRYLIAHPFFQQSVSAETLKEMRCRYLISGNH